MDDGGNQTGAAHPASGRRNDGPKMLRLPMVLSLQSTNLREEGKMEMRWTPFTLPAGEMESG